MRGRRKHRRMRDTNDMKQAFASGETSPDGFGPRKPSLAPTLERVLRRIFQGEPDVLPEPKTERQHATPTSLLSRFDFESALVAIFAPDGIEARAMKANIEDAGGTALIITQFDIPEAWLQKYAPLLTCCIVGHDFADADDAINFCLRLRLIAPDMVTVLTLDNIKTHDFSSTRMPVCDATLRRPVSRVPLFLGLQAACDNRTTYNYQRGQTG